MSGSQFDVLAALVLSGEATDEQKLEFRGMLESSKEKQVAFEKLKRVWHTNLPNSNGSFPAQKEQLWRRYQKERHLQTRRSYAFHVKVAAGILLLLAAGLAVYLVDWQSSESDNDFVVAVTEVVKETNPGERLKTRLPDGTVVFLNAGSRLSYPEFFSDSARTVQLIGEGYFEVAEDKLRPFTVETQTVQVTALGTSFGVNVYPMNSTDLVALVSGRLLIRNLDNQEMRLDSGQAVVVSRSDRRLQKAEIEYLRHVAWKDGVLYFDNDGFEDIVRSLELNYGVKFSVETKVSNSIRDTYTGAFKNESLDNVLKVLSFSMDFKYNINGKEIMITKQ